MRTLFFVPFALWSPELTRDLELMERHASTGDSIVYLRCRGTMLTCEMNGGHDLAACHACDATTRRWVREISAEVHDVPLLNLREEDRRRLATIPTTFESVAEIKKLELDNFDLGYAALSSLVSATRDPDPDLERYRSRVRDLIQSGAAIYLSIRRYLREVGTDRCYVFNGRFVGPRAALRACEAEGVPCVIHERGGTLDRVGLYEGGLPHEPDLIAALAKEAWAQAPPGEREGIGASYFENLAAKKSMNWVSFVADQNPDALPQGWDRYEKRVAVFLSSEDEFVAIGDSWTNDLFATQMKGLDFVADSLRSVEDAHVFVRVHPNLRDVGNSQTRAIEKYARANVSIVPAASKVSTYAMLRGAWKVVTFGSTVGVEAAYWGVPSVLLGQSLYRALDATYNPDTRADALRLLREDLSPRDREGALVYGYHASTHGSPFRFGGMKSTFAGEFRGAEVKVRDSVATATRWASRLLCETGRGLLSEMAKERVRKREFES